MRPPLQTYLYLFYWCAVRFAAFPNKTKPLSEHPPLLVRQVSARHPVQVRARMWACA